MRAIVALLRDHQRGNVAVAREAGVDPGTVRRARRLLECSGSIPPLPDEPGSAERAAAALARDPARSNRLVAIEARCDAHTIRYVRRDLEARGVIPLAPERVPRPYPPQHSRTREAIALLGTSATPRQIADAAGVTRAAAWKMLRDVLAAPVFADAACAVERMIIIKQEQRECERCGAPFTAERLPHEGGKQQVYCGPGCARDADIERKRAARQRAARPQWRRVVPPRNLLPHIPDLPPRPDFSRGLCTTAPPAQRNWWVSSSTTEREAARHICRSCPVLQPCAEWSLSLPVADPCVYGGMLQWERQRRKKGIIAPLRHEAGKSAQPA
jgi:transposase-like protein